MNYVHKSNLIGVEALSRSLATEMKANGFELVAVDGAETDVIASTSVEFLFHATDTVDTQADKQPWAVLIRASDAQKYLDVNILPQLQVDTSFRPVKRSSDTEAGRLSIGSNTSGHFIDLVSGWKMDATASLAAYPLSFDLVTTDHGFALSVNAEGFDNTGTAHSWFVAQRGITDGEATAGEQSPMFCVFSSSGGQNGDPDLLNNNSVLRYTVIEAGVFSVTNPISAVVPTPDGSPIINPLQSVMIAPDNSAIVLFPQIINTHRYTYFTTLDLLGYTSADVISAASEVDLTPATVKTTYRGMNANGKDNRGMRILFPIKTA